MELEIIEKKMIKSAKITSGASIFLINNLKVIYQEQESLEDIFEFLNLIIFHLGDKFD